MTQPTPIAAERHGYPTCRRCGAKMRLYGIEPHPTVEGTELRTYVCSRCEELETDSVPLPAPRSCAL